MEEGEGADEDDKECRRGLACKTASPQLYVAYKLAQKGKRELTMIVSSANGATQMLAIRFKPLEGREES